jgi:HK97 family phage major capsid protein
MKWQSIDAFETWLTDHIAKRIANAKEKHILSRLDDSTYGIAASNVMTNKTYTADTIREIFGAIGENGIKRVYANNKTIYTGLFGIEDKMGRPLFTESSTTDPKVAGRILGSEVKEDGNIADDVAYFGVPASLLTNDFEELYIQSDVEPKTFKDIIGGYSLFDAGLENPIAFVKVTFTRAQAQQGE